MIGNIFPSCLMLTSLAFFGHASRTAMEIGPHSRLTYIDIMIMKNIHRRLGPGAPILLNGCSSASDNLNLARTFSLHAPGHVVFGSPCDYSTNSLKCVYSPTPRLIPTYSHFIGRDGFRDEIKAYLNNELVVNESDQIIDETVYSRIAALMPDK